MNWSAKLFLSVVCFCGTLLLFFFMIATIPSAYTITLSMIVATLPVVGFLLALLTLRYEEQERSLAKIFAILHALLILGIGYLYYVFATNFHLNFNFRFF